jgi:2-oxoglutarate ferredoxin oxidoreductase subunit gamma
VNASLAYDPIDREDVQVLGIPATEMADELGNARVVNSIMLGAYVAATRAVELESLAEAIREQLKSRPSLIDVNMQALRRGAALVAAESPEVA